jgi:hypothetical protein
LGINLYLLTYAGIPALKGKSTEYSFLLLAVAREVAEMVHGVFETCSIFQWTENSDLTHYVRASSVGQEITLFYGTCRSITVSTKVLNWTLS